MDLFKNWNFRSAQLKRIVALTFLLTGFTFNAYSQEDALVMDINVGDEIWLTGQLVIHEGWPPNLWLKVPNNRFVGIDEDSLPAEIIDNLFKKIIRGNFRLKRIMLTSYPYYEHELMVFAITDYKDIVLEE